ncbi:PKD domain-containing protein [Parasediminibacterium paludis]|uniref:PKD domain-containing protein n=1 Tax=Parasediminibacterium paludis TaxID=908966 RepID=A0ABV8PWS8_9BACT
MRKIITYGGMVFLLAVMATSCNKNNTTSNNAVDSTAIIGTVTTSHDTTIVTVGSVEIRYSKTAPCYPSTELFTLTASTTNLPSAATFNWYFGDGNIATGKTVQHGYDAPSPYVIRLDVKDTSQNVIATATFPVKAWGQQLKPVAIFSYKNDFNDNLNYITFNSASSVNRGALVQYRWNWNDGSKIDTVANGLIRHQFPSATTDIVYPVKLTIQTDAGCTADTTVNVTVLANYPITGDFNAVDYDACTNEYFLFTPTATNVPSGAYYVWNFSDGRGDTTAPYPIKYVYQYMNDYDVIMTVVLNNRVIYKTHKLVSAKGSNPKPKASFYTTLVNNTSTTTTYSFNSQSTITHGGISAFLWDFGNGTTDNNYSSFIENVYTKTTVATNYTVRLIVQGNGCADTTYRTVAVGAK